MIRSFSRLLQQKAFAYGSVILFHLALICIAFHKHIFEPATTLFTNWGDGMKNNFTLISFVKEPVGKEGIFKYNRFSYPFGDYVYAADNTPFFAVPFRWFCHHIYDLSDYTIACFNWFVLSNIIACGIVAFFVFRRLWRNDLLAWLMALILPWTNFQLARIFASHFNLSFTSFNLIAIALFLWWQKAAGNTRKQCWAGLSMCLFGYACFLCHGYYMAIIPVFLSGMLFFSGLWRIRGKEGRINIAAALLVPALTAGLVLLTMKTTDGYFDIRQEFARGYDWMEQKTNFSLMFTRYSFHRVFFPVWIDKNGNDIELMAYLGNIGLYTTAILFLISLFSRRFRLLLLDIQKDFFRNPLTAGIFFSGLLMLSMSFGEFYYPLEQKLFVTLPFATGEPAISIAEALLLLALLALVVYSVLQMIRHRGPALHTLPVETGRKKVLRIAGFYLLCVVVLYLMFGHYHVEYVKNYSNPLYVLHKFTRMVEQFRSMVRFAWPFYWTFYIWIIFTLAGIYRKTNRYTKLCIVSAIVLLGGSETFDFVVRIREVTNQHSPFAKKDMQPLQQLKVPFGAYQAILPIPYYNIGSEVYEISINDIDDWSRFTYQLSLYSTLPMMSCKMSRTPPAFSSDLLALVSNDTCSSALKSRMNARPILVAVNRNYIHDSTLSIIPDSSQYPGAYAAYWRANQLAERNHLKVVDSIGPVYFYSWTPQAR